MTGLLPPTGQPGDVTGPPMYPPGWYPDPSSGTAWRWWDGGRWTERTAPFRRPQRTRSGLPTVSHWLDETLRGLRTAARALWWQLGLVWLGVALWTGAIMVAAAVSDRGRVIRDALDLDRGVLFSGSSRGAITDTDAERAGDAFGELMVDLAPWLAATIVLVFAASCWTHAAVAVATRWRNPADRVSADRVSAGQAGPDRVEAQRVGVVRDRVQRAGRSGVRRAPAVAIAWVAIYVVLVSAMVVLAAPAVLAWVAGADGVSIVILALFAMLAAVVVLPFLGGRLALAPTFAALGGRGVGLTASWSATAGRFWAVIGRLLLAGLLAGAVVGAAGSMLTVVQFLDVVAYLAAIVTFQGVAALVQTAVLVPGQVVLVEQIEELDEGLDAGGPTTAAVTGAM